MAGQVKIVRVPLVRRRRRLVRVVRRIPIPVVKPRTKKKLRRFDVSPEGFLIAPRPVKTTTFTKDITPRYLSVKKGARSPKRPLKKILYPKRFDPDKMVFKKDDYITTPYIVAEKILPCDPWFEKPANLSFREVPLLRLVHIFGDYIRLHRWDLELTFLNGKGYKFKFVSRKWVRELITIEVLEKPPPKDYCYWIRYLAFRFYSRPPNRLNQYKLRVAVANEVMKNWEIHKFTIKKAYTPSNLFFREYNPLIVDAYKEEKAKFYYLSLQLQNFDDFTIFELAIACRLFKTHLTIVESTLDNRFFIRKLGQQDWDKDNGLFVWAKEYLDATSMKHRRYFLTRLDPRSCFENEGTYNSMPSGEMRLTYRNHKMWQYRLAQCEYNLTGYNTNLEVANVMRLKQAYWTQIYFVNDFIRIPSFRFRIKEHVPSVRFNKKVYVKFYRSRLRPCCPRFMKYMFRFIKWVTKCEPWCLRTRIPGFVRDFRHKPLQFREDVVRRHPPISTKKPKKSILKSTAEREKHPAYDNSFPKPWEIQREVPPTSFHKYAPYDYFVDYSLLEDEDEE